MVVVAVTDLRERLDGVGQRDRRALDAGELLGHVGVLRQEALDAAGPVDEDLVLLGELVDAEDRDDVLQLLVALEDPLHAQRRRVVLLGDVPAVEDAAGRGERVDGRVDAERGDLAGQLGGGVEVREGRGRGRVGVVVGRHVDRLHRGDRVTTRRGDPLLERAHLVGEGRLVADRGRHPAEQGRDLGPGLGEPEDVVDEEQHVLALHVAEVLRHRQRRQGHAQAGARRLVHLAEDEGGLPEDAGLLHLDHQVVALTGALADTGEHRHTTVVARDAGDHLLDEHGLADARTAEQADLAALHVRGEQVDDLDAGLEHLGLGLELVEGRGGAVDAPALLGLEGLALGEVHDLTGGVEDLAQGDVADGHGDRAAGVLHRGAADQAVGRLQGDGAHHVVADVLRDLEVEVPLVAPTSTSVVSRLYCSGMPSTGNSTSTTGPMMREMRPTPPTAWVSLRSLTDAVMVSPRSLALGQRAGAADDFADLLGDLGLTSLVGQAGVLLDELLGVVRGRLHRPLAGGELGRGGLEHAVEEPGVDVLRQQRVEHLLGAGLEGVQRQQVVGIRAPPHPRRPRAAAAG